MKRSSLVVPMWNEVLDRQGYPIAADLLSITIELLSDIN